MPKVLYFTDVLLPLTQTFVAEQARALQRYEPVLLGITRDAGHPVADLAAHVLAQPSQNWRRRLATAFPHACLSGKVAELAPDIIHAHFGPNATLMARTARKLGIPLVVTFYGYDLMEIHKTGYSGLHWAQYQMRRGRLNRDMGAGLCFSAYLQNLAIGAGFDPAKLTVHYQGTRLSTAQPLPFEARSGIVYAGRLVEKKAPDVLLDAVALLRKAGIEEPLTFVGGGELLESLKARAAGLRHVTFTGPLPWEQTKQAMAKARIFCLPSRAEGLGQVLLEAQTMGVPVVTARGSGAGETMVEGETGLLADPGCAASLAKCLTALLQPERNAAFSARAVAHVARNFDLHRQSRKLEAIYDAVIQGAGMRHE